MKTAMQELITLMHKPVWRLMSNEKKIEMFNFLLEKEKEQIMKAYKIGFSVSKHLDMDEASYYAQNDYYNQAYNQNNQL